MNDYQQLHEQLKARISADTEHPILMDPLHPMYWMAMPAYGFHYIRPLYEMITDMEGLILFVDFFCNEWDITENQAKKLAIENVVFPIYLDITGRNYETNYFKALI